jgi:hypothetical protein
MSGEKKRQTNTHELKTWPEYFVEIFNRRKTFELRRDDRDFQVGDYLTLKEWNPETEAYTGRVAKRHVTYLMRGPQFGLAEGWVLMSAI